MMRIRRILTFAGMALGVFAFAVPAAAQASVVLTEGSTALEQGAKVTATSTNLQTTTGTGTLKCAKVTAHFEVKANNETDHVILDPLGQIGSEGCFAETGMGNLPVTITDHTTLTPLTIDTDGTGWTGATFVSDVFMDAEHKELIQTCEFIGAVHVQSPATGSDVINVGPAVLAGIGPGCSAQLTMEGEFTLETSDGTPVDLHWGEEEE